jgi:tRNA threonylcarbamoyladenosine biosynthesis protein TsaE
MISLTTPNPADDTMTQPTTREAGSVHAVEQVATREQMRRLGERLAGLLRAGDLVLLTGDLGAGKTTLTQGIAAGLGVRGPITSPTFVIARVHPSEVGGPALVHVDAYRLGSIAEVDDLDLDAGLDEAVTVVEWGEGLVEGLSADRLHVHLVRPHGGPGGPDGDPDQSTEEPDDVPRQVSVEGVGPRWRGVQLPRRTAGEAQGPAAGTGA